MFWFILECSFWRFYGAHDNSFFYECLRFTPKTHTVRSLTVGFCFAHVCVCVCVLSRVWCFVTLWTVACQVPLSLGFPRQEYWNELPFLPPGDLLDPGIEPASLASPALAGGFFTTSTTWRPSVLYTHSYLLDQGQTPDQGLATYIIFPFCNASAIYTQIVLRKHGGWLYT